MFSRVIHSRISYCPTCKIAVLFEVRPESETYAPARHLAPCGEPCFGGGLTETQRSKNAGHGGPYRCPKGCP
jgi:hypothetical protein